MHVAQAKIVGGGSGINGGTALRNTVRDCEEWVRLGNDAWGWESVEPVYIALEKNDASGKQGLHPLTRMQPKEAGKIQKAFVTDAIACGFPWAKDLNATGAEGVGASPVCRTGILRISAANTFIDPIRGKENFQLWPDTCVDRVVLSHGSAVGVVLDDQRYVSASMEVILSAGAIFSPALLQRSGIGPSALLSSLAIHVEQDLPTGANLADHPCIPPNSESQSQRSLGGSYVGHVAGIGCNVNKPTSHGTVHIRSRDPRIQPLVSPNYLTTESDRACARQCVRSAYQIITSTAMQQQLSPPLDLAEPIVASDTSLDDWIQSHYSSTYHFASSCRMATREQGGVVDQSGRVHGLRKLRVADASVIPTVPAANTMWTTMMFADRIGRSVRDQELVEHGTPKYLAHPLLSQLVCIDTLSMFVGSYDMPRQGGNDAYDYNDRICALDLQTLT
ncbi:hypothetical protein DOTSEDRAFT_63303 [Dothistroma septosporum NZE10]|uniref:Glucose-methanol-choline oxidoreductase N-terminal domain-containing protein n=1 Tax=Dothistroma septosporum (strain NZE10 / CBS 128990) TaxID=675120 RepID=M2Y3X2_DOTSN|nr:hypothetical protein DOTSEDRAFT_63303 [Dothistroma septosporum NZE10]